MPKLTFMGEDVGTVEQFGVVVAAPHAVLSPTTREHTDFVSFFARTEVDPKTRDGLGLVFEDGECGVLTVRSSFSRGVGYDVEALFQREARL